MTESIVVSLPARQPLGPASPRSTAPRTAPGAGGRGRRWLLALASAVTLVCWVHGAIAGTYLDAAALLLDESRRSGEFIQAHLPDIQLAAVAQKLAEARVKAGREMAVPPDVDKAHPHLLMALEAAERAMAAARDREVKRFFHLMLNARQEEQMFRTMLAQQHKSLPDVQRCERR